MSDRDTDRLARPRTVEIVSLPPDQWQSYKTLRLEALKKEPQAFGSSYAGSLAHPDSYWRTRLEDAARGERNWLLFARETSALIGMAGAFVQDEQDIADVVSVYVTEAARGRGIAKGLLSAILAGLGKSDIIKKARLTVNKNQFPAVALYHVSGFEVVHEEEALMGDGKIHAEYVMEKLL